MPAASPVSSCEIVTAPVPLPAGCSAVRWKSAGSGRVPHSNHARVASPFGFTRPARVAVPAPCTLAGRVVTVGGGTMAKLTISPRMIWFPPDATARK